LREMVKEELEHVGKAGGAGAPAAEPSGTVERGD